MNDWEWIWDFCTRHKLKQNYIFYWSATFCDKILWHCFAVICFILYTLISYINFHRVVCVVITHARFHIKFVYNSLAWRASALLFTPWRVAADVGASGALCKIWNCFGGKRFESYEGTWSSMSGWPIIR